MSCLLIVWNTDSQRIRSQGINAPAMAHYHSKHRKRCDISHHYSDVIMGAPASQITSLTIVYSNVYSGEDQRKDQSSASLAFVWGIHRWPVNSPQRASNAENVSIWWRHHATKMFSRRSHTSQQYHIKYEFIPQCHNDRSYWYVAQQRRTTKHETVLTNRFYLTL